MLSIIRKRKLVGSAELKVKRKEIKNIVLFAKKEKKSKYWETMCDILDGQFPKHACKERGEAMVMLAYIEMMLQGYKFDHNGNPAKNQYGK